MEPDPRPPATVQVHDILHPLASLSEWRGCRDLPSTLSDAQAVWLKDKLYVGGGVTSNMMRMNDDAKLYIYTPFSGEWSTIKTPVRCFAIVTYQSQLVIVGGELLAKSDITNKLWTLVNKGEWSETIPPMITKRSHATAAEYKNTILVASSVYSSRTTVEIYNGHHWAIAHDLPRSQYDTRHHFFCLKSTVFNDQWYIYMTWYGGPRDEEWTETYYLSLTMLRYLASIRWRKFPAKVPHKWSSLATFGNRLIAVGGSPSTSSIYAYSPHTQSWVHVGDMPVPLSSTCTAVFPTGELMVIGGLSSPHWSVASVYQTTCFLNVASFNPDSQFTKIIEYFGAILSLSKELDDSKYLLQRAIGIENEYIPTKFNVITILKVWLQGRSRILPTWRHLFWALREIKLSHLADQFEALLTGEKAVPSYLDSYAGSKESEGSEGEDNEDAVDKKHIAAVQKAMEERGMLDHTIVHGVFVGPARSGKNSTMERLLCQMPSHVSPSTGVAESVVQVKVIQKSTTFPVNVEKPYIAMGDSAANMEESNWSVMDYDDEAIKLMLINSDSQSQVEIPFLKVEGPMDYRNNVIDSNANCFESDNCKSLNSTIDCSSGDDPLNMQPSSQEVASAAKHPSHTPQPKLPVSYVSPVEIVKVALRKKGKDGLLILQQHFQKTWSLYLTNTGGQMEFQEVLPLLVSGPSVFFFTFRLDRDLNKAYSIEYELSDGTNARPYTSTLTTLGGILQTFSSISAMGTFVYKGLQKREVPLRPKVFLIGTHKDRLNPKNAKDHIAKVDQQLQKALKSTSHYEELVEFAYPSQLIFTVNNFSKDESDFRDIRSAVERVVVRDEFQMTSPAHWLIFSLALRKLKHDVISYDQCLEIARECGLEDSEVDEALRFIHSKMGLIRYFPYEDVKTVVVIHPQHLFDKVTELIVDTFTFEKAGKQQMDTFKQRGIFSLVQFENITSKTDEGIKPFLFAKLLERLRIAAAFQLEGSIMYFFPCALAHVNAAKKQSLFGKRFSSTSANVPPLLVAFNRGYCPKGLAGALVSYLMANEMNSCLSWNLCHEKIFRNQVSFEVGPLDIVVLNIYATHLKITLLPGKRKSYSKDIPVGEVCSAVCKAIETGIIQIAADINYVSIQHYLTFSCGCKGDHPGVLHFVNGIPYNLSCETKKKKYELPNRHQLWQISCVHLQSHGAAKSSSLGYMHLVYYRLTDDHHSALLKQLWKHAAAWREIGTFLLFTQGELDNIQAKPFLLNRAPVSWLSAMLAEWLQWAPGDSRGSTNFATLDGLKSALNQAGLSAAAHDLGVLI